MNKCQSYGLFIPKKSSKGTVLKPASTNVFGDESDEESGASAVNQIINRESTRAKVKKQTQLEIDKALQEDPNVYEYDAIYDNIQAQKVSTDVKEAQKVDRKPKYIAGLLKMAELRKREEERRIERKVQKEREEEGNQFADKEAFVTSAYKKKMLEQQAEAERERREAAMEEMLDVTKQKDLSGFYRYLYREKTGTALTESQDADKTEDKVKVKEEPHSDSENNKSPSAREKNRSAEKDGGQTSARHRDDDETPPQSKSRSPTENKSKSSTSSRRRSRSREREQQRRHRDRRSRSRSPSSHKRSHKHRHRSRSRDRKRDRSSSDRTKRRSRSGERSRPTREEDGSSGKEIKKRRHSSGEERIPSVAGDKKEAPTETTSGSPAPNERASSPEMLPARPPDEDLDRDDSASESDSVSAHKSPANQQQERDGESESRGRKTEEPTPGKTNEEPAVKYARKTTEGEVSDARQRFLARKLARERARPVVELE